MKRASVVAIFILCISTAGTNAQKISYTPPEFRLTTEWSMEVNPDHPRQEYPRPTMVRKDWKSLNGRWYFELTGKDEGIPAHFKREIIVPFPVESALSGTQQEVRPDQKIWYKRRARHY